MGLQPSPAARATTPLRGYEASRPYAVLVRLGDAERTPRHDQQLWPHRAVRFPPGSHPLIVAGDSFIESLMNDYGDTLQGILGDGSDRQARSTASA